jgi:hypothetical protein
MEINKKLSPQAKDLTGLIVGKLKVLEYAGTKKGNHTEWVCLCECGEKRILQSYLLSKKIRPVRSCGKCLRYGLEDLTGQKFGRLTVQKLAGKNRNYSLIWECLCECGKTTKISTGKLKRGGTKSCGCFATEIRRAVNLYDIVGLVSGRLTVISLNKEVFPSKKSTYLCQCSCGNQKIVKRSELKGSKKTMSCGCYKSSQKPPGEAGFNLWLRSYKSGAKSRGLEFTLTISQFRSIVEKNCYYCGSPPKLREFSSNGHGPKRSKEAIAHAAYVCNGVDRVNNNIGYTPENSITCCKACNLAKGTRGLEEFVLWVKNIYKNLELYDR